jgi:DNA polymerase IV
MPPAGGATILHADLDAFYASVEQLLDPRLRGRPVAVGVGVVLAASYEAKSLGVRAGMPGWRARQLCPDVHFVGGHFRDYQRLGDQVIGVLRDFTPLVERISIDEAFLDVAGTEHLFGPPPEVAAAIRRRVRAEMGLAVSVGVARTKHLAKIASQAAKPDGLVVVEPDQESEFLRPLPVDLIWGVGPATHARLAATGIHTIGDLAATPSPVLKRLLGQAVGLKLGALATNLDPRRVETTRRAVSIGAQHAFGRREATRDVLRSVTLPVPISTTLTLTDLATDLASSALTDHPREREITLVAVSVSQLVDEFPRQLELPLGLDGDRYRPGTAAESARWAVDRALDAIRDRFGRDAVGYAAIKFSELGGVPEEFRELAEHQLRPADAPHREQ